MMLELFVINTQAAFIARNYYRDAAAVSRLKKDNVGVLASTLGMFTRDAVHVPSMFEAASGKANPNTGSSQTCGNSVRDALHSYLWLPRARICTTIFLGSLASRGRSFKHVGL
jgi:hypothetical protein